MFEKIFDLAFLINFNTRKSEWRQFSGDDGVIGFHLEEDLLAGGESFDKHPTEAV